MNECAFGLASVCSQLEKFALGADPAATSLPLQVLIREGVERVDKLRWDWSFLVAYACEVERLLLRKWANPKNCCAQTPDCV
jgi:hypothetical protein